MRGPVAARAAPGSVHPLPPSPLPWPCIIAIGRRCTAVFAVVVGAVGVVATAPPAGETEPNIPRDVLPRTSKEVAGRGRSWAVLGGRSRCNARQGPAGTGAVVGGVSEFLLSLLVGAAKSSRCVTGNHSIPFQSIAPCCGRSTSPVWEYPQGGYHYPGHFEIDWASFIALGISNVFTTKITILGTMHANAYKGSKIPCVQDHQLG